MLDTWKVVVSPGSWCGIWPCAALQLCLWTFKQTNIDYIYFFMWVYVSGYPRATVCTHWAIWLGPSLFDLASEHCIAQASLELIMCLGSSWTPDPPVSVSSARVTGASHLAFYALLVMEPSGQALWAPSLSAAWLWVFLWSLLALGNIAITVHTSDEETGSDRLSKFVWVYPLMWA